MFRPNDPTTKLLVATSLNAAAVGTKREDVTLAEGELAFFSATPPFAKLGATSSPQRFFIEVGTKKGDIKRSAGDQGIVASEISNLSGKCYTPGADEIIKLSNFTDIEANKEYGVKVRVYNGHTVEIVGHHDFTQSFVFKMPNNDYTNGGAIIDLVNGLVNAINTSNIYVEGNIVEATAVNTNTNAIYANPAAVETARLASGATPGSPTPAESAAFEANLGIAIKALPYEAREKVSEYDFDYVPVFNSKLVVSPTVGFVTLPTQTVLQEYRVEQNNGRQLANLEWNVFGWDSHSVIRTLSDGSPFARNNRNRLDAIDEDGKYTTVTITNDEYIREGGREYGNTVQTIIATPCTNTVVRDFIEDVLNAQKAPRVDIPNLSITANCTSCDDVAPAFLETENIEAPAEVNVNIQKVGVKNVSKK